VRPDTALRLRVQTAVTGKTQGEIIDELVQSNLPPVNQSGQTS
jgi:hypothetical protein